MRLARTVGIVGIALLGLASPSRADDGDDAAAWRRKGQAAETIDHDPAKAIEHYRRALAAAGATEAGLAAGLRLGELLEAAGDTKGALATARELAQRFASVMDEPTKERVLDALGRLMPPGSKERTPLGVVVVAGPVSASFEAEPSPLVRRFEDAFQYLSVTDPRADDYTRLSADLLDKLRPLGTDALPVLEWNIRSENLRKATDAMQLLTSGFPTQAVALLERLALDADVLVRGPALSALIKLPASPAKWAALDRLRKVPSLAAQASALRSRMEAEMTEDALLAQHAIGGPEAPSWLRFALEKGAEPALRRALEVGVKDRAQVRDGLVTLTAGGRYANVSADARRDLEAFLRADPEAGTNPEIRRGLAALAAARVYDVPESDAAGRLAARRAAWARIVDMTSPEEVIGAMRALSLAQVLAPADLFTDARFTAAFVSGWQTLAVREDAGSLVALVEPDALSKAGPFWAELATRLLADGAAAPKLLDLAVDGAERKVPADLVDARWVAIASRDLPASEKAVTGFLATAAVQSQDPSFLAMYRTAALDGPARIREELDARLASYRGPELIDVLADLLYRDRDPGKSYPSFWDTLLERRVKTTLSPQALLEKIRQARDVSPAKAAALAVMLGEMPSRTEVLALVREEGTRTGTMAREYARALVALAQAAKSPDAFPMLLRIYRENGEEYAASTMLGIRQYLEKLKDLEGPTRQAEDVGTEVESSLLSPDAAVRIAGVQAIVVLERRTAIARLLKLIRSEKEASVLDEANLMLRKLSKAMLDGAPPASGAPEVHYYKELEFAPDGKPIAPPGKSPPAPAAPTPPQDVPLPGK